MSAVEIRYDAESACFTIDGQLAVPIARDDAIVASREAVDSVLVRSFERALAQYEEQDAAIVSALYLSNAPAAGFDPDEAPRNVRRDYLGGVMTAQVGRWVGAEHGVPLDVKRLLAPLLDRHIASYDGDFRDGEGRHAVENYSLALPGDDRTMQELFELAEDAQALLDAAGGVGALDARSVRDLMAGGRAGALLGQPEASWIDVKSEPHRLGTEMAAFELAKDVAAFANTGDNAIIVWGMATAKAASGGDLIDALRPFELASVDVSAVSNALADRLVPLLTDLEIQVVETRTGYGFGRILIPAQPGYIQPVLVRGAVESGRVLGTHISVPFRVGEDTRHWDASTVHSLIQAGRVALQRVGEGESGQSSRGQGVRRQA